MPREIVHQHPSVPFSKAEPEVSLGVVVGWSNGGGDVQVASTLFHIADHVPVERAVSGGWYANLDRRGCNDLIRHLRRARDQAFGRDE